MEQRKPLRVHYDEAQDVLYVEGVAFTGDLFREWFMPTDKFFRMSRSMGTRYLIVEQVAPCPSCQDKFSLKPVCSQCGCTEENACVVKTLLPGGTVFDEIEKSCHWVEENLCSGCKPGPGEIRVRGPLPQEEFDRRRLAIFDHLADHLFEEREEESPIEELPEPRVWMPGN
jgi:hypothetical protein